MKQNLLRLIAAFAMLLMASTGFGQDANTSGIQGQVMGINGETLPGATVIAVETASGSQYGTVTDLDGSFSIDKMMAGDYTITVTYVGYTEQTMTTSLGKGQKKFLDKIKLESIAIGLAGINIIADRAKERETPVAFSTIESKQLQEQLGSRDIPMVLNVTPNVYSTMQGGGAGDARINVRGFNQQNVAIMINGVPINDMENGWVYWSNWDGIGDATSSIQMQRGLSAVNLATPSIGGTMNVISSPAEQKKGITFKQEYGSGSFFKTTLMAHTGLVDGKWALSAGGVRKTGMGVIDKTWTDAWAYYLGASYNINSKNRLEFYAMGAPQRHGQNLYRQNIAAYDHEYAKDEFDYPQEALDKFPESVNGRYYNETWGEVSHKYTGKQYWNGKEHDRYSEDFINERENYYHKPLINLNWYSQLSDNLNLFTTAYYSGGKGGGSGYYGDMGWDYSGPSRMIDFNATIENNESEEWSYKNVINDSTTVKETQPVGKDQATGILRNSINNQWTVGIISKLRWDISDNFKVSVGVDGRTAEIEHFREVRDLIGGSYFSAYDLEGNRLIDKIEGGSTRYEFAASDFWTTNDYQRRLGDKVDYNFTNTVNWIGGYLQGEYSNGNLTAYGTAGYSVIKYGYTNHFVMAENTANELTAESDGIGGYQIKGGLSYSFTETLSAFGNAGLVSKVPIFDAVINDRDGTIAKDPKNEQFTSLEAGLMFKSIDNRFWVTGNFYYTNWEDRTQSLGIRNEDGSEGFVFLTGMSQKHSGFEIEGNWRPINWLALNFAGSINNWTYTDNVSGTYKDYANPDDEVEYNYYVKDLKVGDAPQTQLILGATVYPTKGMRAQLLSSYYANYYADWDPFTRNDPTDAGQQVWKTPAYTVFDFHFGYELPFASDGATFEVFAHIFNLFDTKYIQDATDNSIFNGYYGENDEYSHKAPAAEVFLGLPRTYNFGLLININ